MKFRVVWLLAFGWRNFGRRLYGSFWFVALQPEKNKAATMWSMFVKDHVFSEQQQQQQQQQQHQQQHRQPCYRLDPEVLVQTLWPCTGTASTKRRCCRHGRWASLLGENVPWKVLGSGWSIYTQEIWHRQIPEMMGLGKYSSGFKIWRQFDGNLYYTVAFCLV